VLKTAVAATLPCKNLLLVILIISPLRYFLWSKYKTKKRQKRGNIRYFLTYQVIFLCIKHTTEKQTLKLLLISSPNSFIVTTCREVINLDI